MTEKPDAIIVGGGFAGLVTAAFLARAGQEVLLLEQNQVVGGRARNRVRDGFTLDNGFHLGPMGGNNSSLAKLLRELGVTERIIDIAPVVHCRFADGEQLYFPSTSTDANALRPFLAKFHQAADAETAAKVFQDIEEMPWKMTELYDNVPLDVWCQETCSSRMAGWILRFQELYLQAVDPELFSAGEFLRQVKDLMACSKPFGVPWSAGYPERGFTSLAEAVAAVVKSHGGNVWVDTPVSQVLVDDQQRVRGVRLKDGREISAPVVVCNVPIRNIFELVHAARFPQWFVDKVRSFVPGFGTTDVWFGLKERVFVEKSPIFFMDPTRLASQICMMSNITPAVAPTGKHLMIAFVEMTSGYPTSATRWAVKNKGVPQAARLEALVGKIVDELDVTFPGFREAVEWHEVSAVMEPLNGILPMLSQPWQERPDVEAPGVAGLYFANADIRMPAASLTDGAGRAGWYCAQRILAHQQGCPAEGAEAL